MRVYVGTYTHSTHSEGVYYCAFDPATGALSLMGLAARVADPSYLALAPSGRTLYACNEVAEYKGERSGALSALAIDPSDGTLRLLNQQPTHGAHPCHVSVDHAGRMAMVANYSGGSLAAFPIRGDGSLGPASDVHQLSGRGLDPQRQAGPHAHSIWPDPTNRWALACDLGTDRVFLFGLNTAEGKLRSPRVSYVRVAPGAGPRHIAFHPNGRWAYLVSELRSAVTLFDWFPDRGLLAEVEHVPALPADYVGPNGAADIHLTPDGRYLYASNRGQDALAMFAVDPDTGRLTLLGYTPTGGQHPRNLCLDPTGRWLLVANMNSDKIVTLAIDAASGRLYPTGHDLAVPSPTCILFAP